MGFFLRLINGLSSGRQSLFGCLWDTLVSLHTQKRSTSCRRDYEETTRRRRCTAVQNSAILFGGRLASNLFYSSLENEQFPWPNTSLIIRIGKITFLKSKYPLNINSNKFIIMIRKTMHLVYCTKVVCLSRPSETQSPPHNTNTKLGLLQANISVSDPPGTWFYCFVAIHFSQMFPDIEES